MAVNQSSVKIISDCFVKPKYEVEESKKPYYLLGEDLKWLSIRYVQFGFLYRKPTTGDFNVNSFVEKMKHSLSHALVYYYPLAGRFTTVKYVDEHACSIYVDCNKGPGARLIHASVVGSGVSVSDIVSGEVPIRQYLFDLGETGVVDYDGHTRALVSIQITELEDGVFMGCAMNHSVADGASRQHFINSLSEIFRSINNDHGHNKVNVSHVPIIERVHVPEGCSLIQKLPFLEPKEFISRVDVDPNLRQRTFHFSPSAMAKLKTKTNSECGLDGGDDQRPGKISSFQALSALVWVSITKARKVPAKEMTTCVVPINLRPRLNPPLSSDHFGNISGPVFLTRNVGELLDNGSSGAALILNQTIGAYNHQFVTGYLRAIMDNPSVVRIDDESQAGKKLNLVNFAGGSRFDTYGIDFGLGKAVAVLSGNTDRLDGMVILNGGSERGSVDLMVNLMPHNMAALESDQDFMAYVS